MVGATASDANAVAGRPADRDILVVGKPGPCAPLRHRQRLAPNVDCLNRDLAARLTERRGPVPPVTPFGSEMAAPARSGTFSFTATSQRMGSNFGRSAYPFRPNAPVYRNPVLPAGKP